MCSPSQLWTAVRGYTSMKIWLQQFHHGGKISVPKNPFHVPTSVTEHSSLGCIEQNTYMGFCELQTCFLSHGVCMSSWESTVCLLFSKQNFPCKPPLAMLCLLCFSRQIPLNRENCGIQALWRWRCDSFIFPFQEKKKCYGPVQLPGIYRCVSKGIKFCCVSKNPSWLQGIMTGSEVMLFPVTLLFLRVGAGPW